ncbi:MAG: tRNA epoxyqueuosine(34) reductase QueG [Phycisphaerae bacterium]|nr:tRNA epoxyqueuosine(34) reductase QueG [Phycisphaerae bacterium]
MSFEQQIKQKALDLGFDAVGITTAEPVAAAHIEYFRQWLSRGNAGEMAYMHRNTEKRFDPARLLAGAKSVICVALNYRLNKDQQADNPGIRIARFAQYIDYHPFIKDRLFQLAEFIQTQTKARQRELPDCDVEHVGNIDKGLRFKACVDSVPIAERALAQRAGLGFIGRNHMLIHPELGNQILLGELITTLELEPDEPMENLSCGDCGRCIRACPTGALGFDGTFDARKCISYLTIEAPVSKNSPPAKGEYPEGGRGLNYIFGCDECILACPHETGKPERKNKDFQHHPEWQNLTLDQIQAMTEADFQKTFANSGFIRLGMERLKRNVADLSRRSPEAKG